MVQAFCPFVSGCPVAVSSFVFVAFAFNAAAFVLVLLSAAPSFVVASAFLACLRWWLLL